MSLNKFTNVQIGQDLKLEAGLSKLVVNDEASLRGNVLPSSVGATGSVLVNSDGAGLLSWVSTDLNNVYQYKPTLSVSSGGSINAQPNDILYSLSGNQFRMSVNVAVNSPTSGTQFSVGIPLPAGVTNENINLDVVGIGGDPSQDNPALVAYAVSASPNTQLNVLFYRTDASSFPAAQVYLLHMDITGVNSSA